MKEDTYNAVTRTLVDSLATAGESLVRHALVEAGIDPQATAASADPTRIAKIIAPLLAERWERTLAQALPNLAIRADVQLPFRGLSTRAKNIARDNRLLTAGALGAHTVTSVWSLRNAGYTTVKEFLVLAVRLHLQLEGTTMNDGEHLDPPTGRSHPVSSIDIPPDERSGAISSNDAILAQPASSLNLSVRARRCLARLDIETIGALVQYSESELLATPKFGHTSLAEIREQLIDRGLTFRRSDCIDAASHPEIDDKEPQSGVSNDGTDESLDPPFVTLGEWATQIRQFKTLGEILTLRQNITTLPEDVQMAASQLLSTSLEHLRASDSHIQRLLDELFVGLDDRAQAIFDARHLCADQVTLLGISKQYGISRERVRQIDRDTCASLRSKLAVPRFRHLRWRFHSLASTLGNGAPESSDLASQALSNACRGLAASARIRALVLWASGPYRQEEGWLLRMGMERPTIPLGKDAFGGEIEITHESVSAWLFENGFSAELASTVMDQSDTVRQVGDKWVRWPSNVTDKAEVILRLLGRPADSVEVIELIGEEYSDLSLRSRLLDDDRFIRVNKRHFALATWGLEEYSGITQEIIERIERDGDSTDLEALVAELVRQFEVSELSVRAYANAPMFVIEKGAIRLRGGSDEYSIDAQIETVQGLFPDPDRGLVHLVIPADADLRQSSGATVKEPVAAALGMKPGDRLVFTAGAGGEQIVLSWPESSVAGPYLGGTRALFQTVEGEAGDECVLTLDPQRGGVSVRGIPNGDINAASLTGLAIERGHELDAIAISLGCKRTAVRAILAARGDHRLLSIMPSCVDDPKLDNALANLADVLGET